MKFIQCSPNVIGGEGGNMQAVWETTWRWRSKSWTREHCVVMKCGLLVSEHRRSAHATRHEKGTNLCWRKDLF